MGSKDQSGDLSDSSYEELGIYMSEAGISVSLTSFMTAVVIFFIGLLLTGDEGIQMRLRIPLVLLFISAFGFLYSTLIYSNASGEIARLKKKKFDKQMAIGNILSEYLGVYCLAFAVPIVVLGYSPDKILSILVLVISEASFITYHLLGYAIIQRYISNYKLFIFVVVIFVIIYTLSFISFYFEYYAFYYLASLITILLVIAITIFSIMKGET